ncbi:hypothetical protein [Actinomadura formosensis]|uniref:hypothetical protein n=1 Tax=Actinomadura formosensis TaxID=60706 RepID=UPI003D8B02E2
MNEIEMTQEIADHAQWLASAAMVAYMGDAEDTAVKAVQRIGDECGPEGVELAMRGWIDTMADRLGIKPGGRAVAIKFQGLADDGEPDASAVFADAVERPEVVWAGRLMAARVAMDQDTYLALLDALPDDPAEVGAHVGAVLEMCSLTMASAGVTP